MRWSEIEHGYPPGYIVPDGVTPDTGKFEWGSLRYGRRHGQTVMHYDDADRLVGIDKALLPSGERSRVLADGRTPTGRRPLNDCARAWDTRSVLVPVRWMSGTVEITPDDVLFYDTPAEPSPDLGGHGAEIKAALYGSGRVEEFVGTPLGALAMMVLLRSGDLVSATGVDGGLTYDDAAGIVADCRRLGERFSDIKLGLDNAMPADRELWHQAQEDAYDCAASLGWTDPKGSDGRARQETWLAAMAALENYWSSEKADENAQSISKSAIGVAMDVANGIAEPELVLRLSQHGSALGSTKTHADHEAMAKTLLELSVAMLAKFGRSNR